MLEEDKKAMQQPSPTNNELMLAINPIVRQLEQLDKRVERMDERSRSDLEALRRELVAQRELEIQMAALRNEIKRVNDDRVKDKEATDKRLDDLEKERMTRTDRLWIRLGQIGSITALLVALFEFLSHYRFFP